MQALGYSPATIKHTSTCVRLFSGFLLGINDVRKVTTDDLRLFIFSLRDRKATLNRSISLNNKKLSLTTINTYTRAIKAFWSWLLREGILSKNPLAIIPSPRFPRKLPKIFSEEQITLILRAAAINQRDLAIIALLLDSGIRLSELTGITPKDIDIKNGTLKVYSKGGKERYAYFSPHTALMLNDYTFNTRPEPLSEDKLFLTKSGEPLKKEMVQKNLVRIGEGAGISERLSPHKLRHTYATLSLKNGNNLEYLRITLGHKDIKTTSDAYLAAAAVDIAIAHRKSSPISNILKVNQLKRRVKNESSIVRKRQL